MPAFARYIGIDYSGAQTPTASLSGLRVYMAEGDALPVEVSPPASRRKYWSRRGIAEWLAERLAEQVPTLVGIDHGFSFPLRYFEAYGLKPDWPAFLDDFQRHWPTDDDHTYVDFVREGVMGNGAARAGNARWRRLTEERAGGAKSVFQFDVQGSVAKSTHAGIPWLRFIRHRRGARLHFWPFDGWDIPANRSAIAEVYPSLWRRGFAPEGRTPDQHDAFCIAAWLARADRDGTLAGFLKLDLSTAERAVAQVEGWILGVPGLIGSDSKRKESAASAACDPSRVARTKLIIGTPCSIGPTRRKQQLRSPPRKRRSKAANGMPACLRVKKSNHRHRRLLRARRERPCHRRTADRRQQLPPSVSYAPPVRGA